ncbi:anhydro-N-acetylmuramic acid kinase [Chryseosolibacter indicus]|uniref:Anhydro-N-acetylmuramic acid kinase n=1 Tax=Chryseosolibacter indicus TaxID=2782351 RepID=A0ABS5VV14_9BACT|nr:anhydro-N-acetylmuramic acid kinase [Chryseosolibacter indicus]MBT1704660.1 anhydro-N-acetylmuramic acid kinase [Chryseosolibacter indicus]
MDSKDKYKVIGLMSGTSLDGLDIAFCSFIKKEKGWSFKIDKAETVKYSSSWMNKLSQAHQLSGEQLIELDISYGELLGALTKDFLVRNKLKADFIASHGHTIFHQPRRKFTYQLGNGNAIHAITNTPVVYDFRSLDVVLGGEGAPLVPAGDEFLFDEYDVCLNLGGIANLSTKVKKQRLAYDICFTNMGLNYLASLVKKSYDKDGVMASTGEINSELLKSLNKIYNKFRNKRPSLGREMFELQILPLLNNKKIPLEDKLRTFTESAAREIIDAIVSHKKNVKVLCTGGGAFNSFLISRMLELGGDDVTLIIPEDEIIKFKEALVFAFLGLLRIRGEVNCLKSVTGASKDSSGGILAGF